MKIILTKELHAAVDAAWHRDSSYQAIADVLFAGYESGFELEPAERIALTVATSIAKRGEDVGANTSTVLICALERAQRLLVPKPAELTPELEQVAKDVYLEWMNSYGNDYGRAVCNAVRAVLAKVSVGKAEQAAYCKGFEHGKTHGAAYASAEAAGPRGGEVLLREVSLRKASADPERCTCRVVGNLQMSTGCVLHGSCQDCEKLQERIAELEAQLAAMQTEAKAAWREVLLLQDELAPYLAAKPALTVDDVRSALAASAAGANGGAK